MSTTTIDIMSTTTMEYKDAVGLEISVGDHIVYSAGDGALQLGRVLELSSIKEYDYVWDKKNGKYLTGKDGRSVKRVSGAHPALKIQGARRSYNDADKFEKMKPSVISKFQNVLVLNNNLVAQLTLM
jgi:hypothetical protein